MPHDRRIRELRHLSLRMDEAFLQKLEYVAGYEGRSMNSTVVQLVRRYVVDFEEKHGAIELKDKMESF